MKKITETFEELINEMILSDYNEITIEEEELPSNSYSFMKKSNSWHNETSLEQEWNGFLLYINMEIGVAVLYSPMDTVTIQKYSNY